ncbi:MAG TPA: hypothetical protein VM123_12155 [archaeon]|nr:hypothetical protein [archaeon]
MKWQDKRSRRESLLPEAYRRWPLLSGVAAGLWFLVLLYLVRMILKLFQGDRTTAFFSLLWSMVCLVLWTLLHYWAKGTTR